MATILSVFRIISLPFFTVFDFLYRMSFQIKPIGKGLFAVEKRPCRYSGQLYKFPNGITIKNGDNVIGLHIVNSRLSEVFNKRYFSRENMLSMLMLSLKELAEFSAEDKRDFSAFYGETSIRFSRAKNYGFLVVPINGSRSKLKASLQFFYRKNPGYFPKRKLYRYIIPREILNEKFHAETQMP